MVTAQFLKTVLKAIQEKFNEIFKSAMKKDISEVQEQTVLASIVLIFKDGLFEIISIANGTKSIGKKNMSVFGNIVNDSHAEVLARRGFKRFLCENLNNPKYFLKSDQDKYVKNFKVLFYTSQTPCGQSSIFANCFQNKSFPKDIDHNQNSKELLKGEQDEQSNQIYNQKLFQNTGAKYYSFIYDEKYQVDKDCLENILRIKPGRTDLPQDTRSLSLSCSDKIMLWNVIGLQGSLLARLMDEPIYIDYFFIESDGQDIQKFKEIVSKGINIKDRLQQQLPQKQLEQRILKWHKKTISKNYVIKQPPIIVTKKYFFKLNRNICCNKPKYLDQHIIYMKSFVNNIGEVKEDYLEVLNGSTGLRWGMGEKGSQIPKNYPSLCKYNLFKAFSQARHMSSSQCCKTNKNLSIKYKLIKNQLLALFQEKIADKQEYNSFFLSDE